ncbi:MAG: hypothetical protein KGI02_08875 [Thaumarchaeota archaeon]|nr:hypothetical protein [Nitrososphaerota archaeon]
MSLNNKTKLLTSLLICATLTIGVTQMSFAQTTVTGHKTTLDLTLPRDVACMDKIQQDEKSQYASFDEKKAITSALGYSALKAEVKRDSQSDGHVVMIWSYDPVNCIASPIGTSVQFMVTDSASHKRLVIVSEDPKSLTPNGISVDDKIPTHAVSSAYNTIWTGYELRGAIADSTTPVYQSYLTYSVPSAAVPTAPSGFTCGTSSTSAPFPCDAAVWSGLAISSGGSTGLVQTGTDSICSGTTSGQCQTKTYDAWLEFNDAGTPSNGYILSCAARVSLTPNASDSVDSQVTNYVKYGQGTKDYDLWLVDITQNLQCTTFGVGFNNNVDKGDPYDAEYILERPPISSGDYRLDNFGTLSNMHGTIYYSNTNNGIYTPFNAGYGHKIIMHNTVNNTSVTDVNTSNNFNISWTTSANTN